MRPALLCLLTLACDSTSEPLPSPTPAPVRALSNADYNETIRALLALPADGDAWPELPAEVARVLPPSRARSGLFGTPVAAPPPWPWSFPEQTADASAYQVEALHTAARHFAPYTLVSPVFFTCDWATTADREGCGWDSVLRFTHRAWRRPLTEPETARLRAFWAENLAAGTAAEAVVLTVSGVLQAPGFVYRIEPAQDPRSGWEMAVRMAYFLWEEMPDAALFGAAARGDLDRRSGLEAQALRMLDDPRARRAVVAFHSAWLDVPQVQRVAPARRVYGPVLGLPAEPVRDTADDGEWPAALGPLRYALEAEFELFVERTVFDGAGTLTALLTDHHGYVSGPSAPVHQVDPLAGPEVVRDYALVVNSLPTQGQLVLRPAAFDPAQRAGILTQPAVLAVGAYAVHPAPVLRGKRLLERVACQSFGPPPPAAESAAPADVPEAASTNRARAAAATAPDACQGCHQALDPAGFAFEHYDALGRWRAQDNGVAVDASGTLALAGGESYPFEDGVDLAHQLATSDQVRDCYVRRWAEHAVGGALAGDARLATLQARFRADDDVRGLLVAIVTSDLFRRGQP